MRNFLILAVLFFSSACHNPNSTSKDPSLRKMPFDPRVFLSIPHEEEQSLLRRKLLNTILNSDLKKNNSLDVNESVIVENEDQFKFVSGNYKFSKRNLIEYKNAKANCAEVIVSHSDQLDIFFVPQGIHYNKAFQQLGLRPSADSNYFWVDNEDNYLIKNKTYYILDASKKELKNNDVYFNSSQYMIGSDFNEKISSFSTNQIIKLKMNVAYFKREIGLVSIHRKDMPNRKDCDREADTCGPCTFELETSGKLIPEKLLSTDLLDLDIIINGRNYHLSELSPFMDQEGNISVVLDLKKLVNTEMVSIEFHLNELPRLLKRVSGMNYSGACMNEVVTNVIDVTPSLTINLSATILGRKL